jgi:Phosphotransferase system cellobiose-specific component IIC
MRFGLVNRTYVYPGWNIPTPIAQFLATMDWRAVVLALALIVLDGLIYLPFLRVYEKRKIQEESRESAKEGHPLTFSNLKKAGLLLGSKII